MGAGISNDGGANAPITDINVTPFVDVVLVLLVIFMVTAPTIFKDSIGIQLPKASTSDDRKSPSTFGVAINRDGVVLLNGASVSLDALSSEVKKALQSDPETQAILSADQDSRHGDVVKVIDTLKSAGLNRFAIQIRKEEK